MKHLTSFAKIFKALSNPYRLDLYLRIQKHHVSGNSMKEKGPCLLVALCNHLKIGAPTISHHLKELVNAGLIEVDKNGKYITCKLNEKTSEQLRNMFNCKMKLQVHERR